MGKLQKTALVAMLAGALCAAASGAHARAIAMVQPARIQLVNGPASEPASTEPVRHAILAGGRDHGWILDKEDGSMLTMEAGNGGHRVTVDVVYDATGFQIKYRGSVDMNYAVENGTPMIHAKYNKWVTELGSSIRAQAYASGLR